MQCHRTAFQSYFGNGAVYGRVDIKSCSQDFYLYSCRTDGKRTRRIVGHIEESLARKMYGAVFARKFFRISDFRSQLQPYACTVEQQQFADFGAVVLHHDHFDRSLDQEQRDYSRNQNGSRRSDDACDPAMQAYGVSTAEDAGFYFLPCFRLRFFHAFPAFGAEFYRGVP